MSLNTPLNSKEVHNQLDNYQAGIEPTAQTNADNAEVVAINSEDAPVAPPEEQQKPDYSLYDVILRRPSESTFARSYTDEALREGYGNSKHDTGYAPGMDIEHNRAEEQSWSSKVINGALKMTLKAGTTLANGTAGLLAGAGTTLFELATNASGKGRENALDTGVNNFVSTALMELDEGAAKILPNYKTKEERTEQYQEEWWKPSHWVTGNFLGDDLLTNFGFTLGGIGSGATWSSLIGKGMSRKLANNVMKGAILSSADDAMANEMRNVADAIKRKGLMAVDAEALAKNLSTDVAKKMHSASLRTQLYGAALGAMAEGSVEGITNKNEFLDEYMRSMHSKYADEYNNIEKNVLASRDSDYVQPVVYRDDAGHETTKWELTEDGRKLVEKEQQRIIERYSNLSNEAVRQADKLATTTFLLNLPILTTSNFIQFGSLFTGGWRKQRAGYSPVDGSIKKGFKQRGTVGERTTLKVLQNIASESAEEMLQGTAASGATQVVNDRLASYNNAGFDDEATAEARSWFESMLQGAVDYLGDVKNWKEGFLGGLTGALGIPGKQWHGGVIGAYQESKGEIDASQKAAEKLNAIVNDKDFTTRWQNYIRHIAFEQEKEDALAKDNAYLWHNANDKQIISDIIAFDDADQLEELLDFTKNLSNITEAQANEIKDLAGRNKLQVSNDVKTWIEKSSAEDLVNHVKKYSEEVTKAINTYKDLYQNLALRAPQGSSPEFLKELVFTSAQIKRGEDRFLRLFDETMESLKPVIDVNALLNEDNTFAESKEKFETNLERVKHVIEQATGSLLPLNLEKSKAVKEHFKKVFDELERQAEGNNELIRKIKDLRAISQDRQDYFRKLQLLMDDTVVQKPEEKKEKKKADKKKEIAQNTNQKSDKASPQPPTETPPPTGTSTKGQEAFKKQAVTPAAVNEASQQAGAAEFVKSLTSYDAVKKQYLQSDFQGKNQLISALTAVENANPVAKEFLAVYRKWLGFKEHVEKVTLGYQKSGEWANDQFVTLSMTSGIINDLFRRADTVMDLEDLEDGMFPTETEFNKTYKSLLGVIAPSAYHSLKTALRKEMKEWLKVETATASRKAIDPHFKAPEPSPSETIEPTGYDPSQMASSTPLPNKKAIDEKLAEQAKAKETESQKPTKEKEKIEKTLNPEDADEVIGFMLDLDADDMMELESEEDSKLDGLEEDELNLDESGEKFRFDYIRGSVPEIDSYENKNARKLRRTLTADKQGKNSDTGRRQPIAQVISQEYNLKDFVKAHPEYEETYNALIERNAFKNMAEVRVGTKIRFTIDPTFPTYEGKQILIETEDGKVLNVLPASHRGFKGVSDLRNTIELEYAKWANSGGTGKFVFSKTSTIFAKLGGHYNVTADRALQNARGYDPNATIYAISRNPKDGTSPIEERIKCVRGKADKAVKTRLEEIHAVVAEQDHDTAGLMYYVQYVHGKPFIIPLKGRVFNQDCVNIVNPMVQKIKAACTEIVEITKSAGKIPLVDENGNTVLDERGYPVPDLSKDNDRLREAMGRLVAQLDMKNDFFTIQDVPRVGLSLRWHMRVEDEKTEDEKLPDGETPNKEGKGDVEKTPDKIWTQSQISVTKLIDFIASLNRMADIRMQSNEEDSELVAVTPEYLEQRISDGAVVVNVDTLYPKGTDAMMYAWDSKTKEFKPADPMQKMQETRGEIAAKKDSDHEEGTITIEPPESAPHHEPEELKELDKKFEKKVEEIKEEQKKEKEVMDQVKKKKFAVSITLSSLSPNLSEEERNKATGHFKEGMQMVYDFFHDNVYNKEDDIDSIIRYEVTLSTISRIYFQDNIDRIAPVLKVISDITGADVRTISRYDVSKSEPQLSISVVSESQEEYSMAIMALSYVFGITGNNRLIATQSVPSADVPLAYIQRGMVVPRYMLRFQKELSQEDLSKISMVIASDEKYEDLNIAVTNRGIVVPISTKSLSNRKSSKENEDVFNQEKSTLLQRLNALVEQINNDGIVSEKISTAWKESFVIQVSQSIEKLQDRNTYDALKVKTQEKSEDDESKKSTTVTTDIFSDEELEEIQRTADIFWNNKVAAEVINYMKNVLQLPVIITADIAAELKKKDATSISTNGKIYGAVTKDGNIYLDANSFDTEAALHEYVHLWDRTVKMYRPELWQRGVKLMRTTDLWAEISNDENYGKKWREENLSEDEIETRIASECHARLSGKEGERILKYIAQRNGGSAIIKKLEDWFHKFWSFIHSTFLPWEKGELDQLTVDAFMNMPIRDFAYAADTFQAYNDIYGNANERKYKNRPLEPYPNYPNKFTFYYKLEDEFGRIYQTDLDKETIDEAYPRILKQLRDVIGEDASSIFEIQQVTARDLDYWREMRFHPALCKAVATLKEEYSNKYVTDYDYLTAKDKETLKQKGVSADEFNHMTLAMQKAFIEC